VNIKRAIGIFFVLFVVVHGICIIWSRSIGIDLKNADPTNMPQSMWNVAHAAAFIFSILGTIWYFRSPKIIPCTKNGFLFGLTIVVFGFSISSMLLLPHKNGSTILLNYFTQLNYWLAYILILIACTIVGHIKSKK